jgi:hypothetical protein
VSQSDQSVQSITMTGHSEPDSFKIGNTIALLVDSNGAFQLWDENQNDLLPVILRTMTPGGSIYLNGCHSAGLAQAISQKLPGISVFGYEGYAAGGNAVGINSACGVFVRRVQYINGQKQ